MTGHASLSILLPAHNEAQALETLLPRLRALLPDAEILVIDDASTDGTREIAERHGARVIRHPYQMGNGAAIKTGARQATGEILVCMDADGQHDPADIPALLARLDAGYDMAVGARVAGSQASMGRSVANAFYNRFASLLTGRKILDLTSGFRAVRAERFREFLHLLPNGFSYPTTITMSFLRAGYAVDFVPIQAAQRSGQSHIRPLRDGLRFLLIIFRVTTLYSPLKLFVPVSFLFFATGFGWWIWTYATQHRLSVGSALLLIIAAVIFMIGLVSEQITNLLYARSGRDT